MLVFANIWGSEWRSRIDFYNYIVSFVLSYEKNMSVSNVSHNILILNGYRVQTIHIRSANGMELLKSLKEIA